MARPPFRLGTWAQTRHFFFGSRLRIELTLGAAVLIFMAGALDPVRFQYGLNALLQATLFILVMIIGLGLVSWAWRGPRQ